MVLIKVGHGHIRPGGVGGGDRCVCLSVHQPPPVVRRLEEKKKNQKKTQSLKGNCDVDHQMADSQCGGTGGVVTFCSSLTL